MKTGIELIAEERERQINEEGYTELHDKNHDLLEFIYAAITYAESAKVDALSNGLDISDIKIMRLKQEKCDTCWPWGSCTFKPTTCKRDLVKAGALIAAAIDRLNLE